jgi:hypothetical protein
MQLNIYDFRCLLRRKTQRLLIRITSILVIFIFVDQPPNQHLVEISLAQSPDNRVVWRTPQQIPSPEGSRSWFPDLAADSKGNVHVI